MLRFRQARGQLLLVLRVARDQAQQEIAAAAASSASGAMFPRSSTSGRRPRACRLAHTTPDKNFAGDSEKRIEPPECAFWRNINTLSNGSVWIDPNIGGTR
ncbi:hypothetical protein [Falsiroseomonas sp. HW251]|uniref:hypothetical protein n=1 Tax=Falsiroseomonas sp. HW251 TaxID=3390998 RepID=UPI003D30F8D2